MNCAYCGNREFVGFHCSACGAPEPEHGLEDLKVAYAVSVHVLRGDGPLKAANLQTLRHAAVTSGYQA